MTGRRRYPAIEPFRAGTLGVGDGHRMHWEESGDPQGKAAVVLHGAGIGERPVAAAAVRSERVSDGPVRSAQLRAKHAARERRDRRPVGEHHASSARGHRTAPGASRRRPLARRRRVVGHLLAVAYAERHRSRVSALVMWGVATGRRSEFHWLFRGGLSAFFPEQWDGSSWPSRRIGDVTTSWTRMPTSCSTPTKTFGREPRSRCLWESATPAWPPATGLDERFGDEAFALVFSRVVTHYVRPDAWIEDGELLRNAGLRDIPGVIVNGRFDFQSPLGSAWALHRAWPRSQLVVVEDAGHDVNGIRQALASATDSFARG